MSRESGTLPALDREDDKAPEQAPPLDNSCEGDTGIQVFLPFASGTRSTHWRQFDVRQRSDACFAPSLLPSSRSTPVCSALHPRRFAPPRRTPHWWDEFRCPSSVEGGLWSSSCGSLLSHAQHPPTNPFKALSRHRLASRAVRLSAAASSLLFCGAAQNSADPGPCQPEH